MNRIRFKLIEFQSNENHNEMKVKMMIIISDDDAKNGWVLEAYVRVD